MPFTPPVDSLDLPLSPRVTWRAGYRALPRRRARRSTITGRYRRRRRRRGRCHHRHRRRSKPWRSRVFQRCTAEGEANKDDDQGCWCCWCCSTRFRAYVGNRDACAARRSERGENVSSAGGGFWGDLSASRPGRHASREGGGLDGTHEALSWPYTGATGVCARVSESIDECLCRDGDCDRRLGYGYRGHRVFLFL